MVKNIATTHMIIVVLCVCFFEYLIKNKVVVSKNPIIKKSKIFQLTSLENCIAISGINKIAKTIKNILFI